MRAEVERAEALLRDAFGELHCTLSTSDREALVRECIRWAAHLAQGPIRREHVERAAVLFGDPSLAWEVSK